MRAQWQFAIKMHTLNTCAEHSPLYALHVANLVFCFCEMKNKTNKIKNKKTIAISYCCSSLPKQMKNQTKQDRRKQHQQIRKV